MYLREENEGKKNQLEAMAIKTNESKLKSKKKIIHWISDYIKTIFSSMYIKLFQQKYLKRSIVERFLNLLEEYKLTN